MAVRRILVFIGLMVWSAIATGAEFKLNNGETVQGDLVLPTANELGLQI